MSLKLVSFKKYIVVVIDFTLKKEWWIYYACLL